MINLMIVEDEKLCREGLAGMPWQQLDVSVSALAENGQEALNVAKVKCPDIIISDINMPDMNGLELASSISVLMPEVKIILLSAYDIFEYAQEAIKYGVCEYILKPFTVKEVMEAVGKTVSLIKHRRERLLTDNWLSEQLENVKPFLKGYFLSAAANPDNNFTKLFSDIDKDDNYCAVILSFSDEDRQMDLDDYHVFVQLFELLKRYEYGFIPFYDKNCITFIFSAPKHLPLSSVEAAVVCICEAVQEYLNYNVKTGYTIGVGQVVRGASMVVHSYDRAREVLKYRFYLGDNNIICINDMEPAKALTDYKGLYIEKYLDCVKICDESGAKALLGNIFRAFKREQEPVQNVQRVCLDLLVQLSLVIIQQGLDPDILYNKTDVWEFLQQYHTIDSLEDIANHITDVTVSQICFTKKTKHNKLIENAKQFISENTGVTLNELARQIYISPCYLSTIFKRETGLNLKDFLMQARLEKAKKLLRETNSSISEISEKVGYKNQQHFSAVFSQSEGVPPTAYRNNQRLKKV